MNISPAILLPVIIITCTIITEWLIQKKIIRYLFAKKIRQFVLAFAFALSPIFFTNIILLEIIVASFAGLAFLITQKGWVSLNEKGGKSWALFFLPTAFLGLLIMFGHYPNFYWLIIYPMLVLAFSDSLSAIVGHFSNKTFKITTDKKSFVGSFIFFLVAWLLLTFITFWFYGYHPYLRLPPRMYFEWNKWLIYAAGLAFVLTILEAICSNGLGNLLIPICAALILYSTFRLGELHPTELLGTIFLATMVATVSYFKRALTLNGAVTAWFMGIVLLWMGGWEWVWPMMVFFITGTVFTKVNEKFGRKTDEKDNRARDYYQVLANGGIGLLCCVLYAVTGNQFWYFIYIFSMSVSMADTWSSEIGMMAGGKVVDFFSRKPVPVGVSGGVTNEGFGGGFAGAMIIGWIGFSSRHFSITLFLITLLAGILGTILDSILGSKLQIKYRLMKSGNLSDFVPTDEKGKYISGKKWMTNDMVNFISNLIITLFCFGMMFWLKL